MIKLHTIHNKIIGKITISEPLIALISSNRNLPYPARADKILILKESVAQIPEGFLMVFVTPTVEIINHRDVMNLVSIDPELAYLDDKDVVKFNPKVNGIQVIYRYKANANSFLVTERCNSFCIMCSQPPRNIDDGYIVNELLQAIPLVDKSTGEIGFTGGEPTLLGKRLLELIQACKQHLPTTSLHILSNGRNFKNLQLAMQTASIQHHDLMWGIPLYSDISQIHDFVVQSDGAYDETIRGILNLKRCQQRVEIRVVIHKQTYKRLPQLAEFIARNLVFVDHVALMGLELMGFTKANFNELWIDPYEYQNELAIAVGILNKYKIRVSVYNHQLCLLHPEIRPFAVKSISDWKNEYIPECSSCALKTECGGFFSSSREIHSKYISPVT